MTTVEKPTTATTSFAWLELTGKCQLECVHCYADSGPEGTHGSMTTADWCRVIDQVAELGAQTVQFIGGEPTLHPGLPELIDHALDRGLKVEVFSNLVHVTDKLWAKFQRAGVSLATSYYSDDADEHQKVTCRPTHARTKENIATAVELGIPLRAGVIDVLEKQRTAQAQQQLVDLGVPQVGYDRLREIGRGTSTRAGGSAAQLCGGCGLDTLAVGPDGAVTPCIMSRWQTVGNVHDRDLSDIAAGMPDARRALVEQGMPEWTRVEDYDCTPGNCTPCSPQGNCYPIHCHPRA